MTHPGLFFSKEDIENYKQRLQCDSAAAARYREITAEADSCLKEELVSETEANGGSGQHADFGLINRQANRFCDCLGVKYLVEGDKACAEKIKRLLLHFISFERWYSASYSVRTPVPWHADLCSTRTTLALGYAFDIIYDYLTPDERHKIAEGILEKGVIAALSDWVLPETRIHALDSMGHNWWAVCIAEAANALLAIADEMPEQSADYLALVDEALADYLRYKGNSLYNKQRNFDEQGLFYEGIGYNNFGSGTLLRYLWCRERYSGRNEVIRSAIPEGFCDSVMTFSYPVTENGRTKYFFLNFGDSGVDPEIDLFAKYAFLLGLSSEALNACLSTYKTDIRDEIGGLYVENLQGKLNYLPLNQIFSSGFAVSRDSYEPDSTLFAVKSGYCWNHSHNDSGSFVIYHKGRPFFIDSGTCFYDSPLYHAYYCQDAAHSVLRVGGKGRRDEELYRGTKFSGTLTDSFSGEDYFFVQADSTGPMAHLCSRMYRNFIWIENRLLVIFDEVYCHEADTIQFSVHTESSFSNSGNEILFDNGISKARLISHHPETVYSEKEGHLDHKEKEIMPYAELSTLKKDRTHLLITTIELDHDEKPFSFRLLEGKNATGLLIEDERTSREIWFNHMADGHVMHDNSNNIIAGYDTDAYMLMLMHNKADNKETALCVCTSYLRKEKSLYSSFIKKTTEISIN